MRRGRRAELRDDSKQFAKSFRETHGLCDKYPTWTVGPHAAPSNYLLHRRHEGDRADLRRREALGPNPTAARFWVSTDSEPIHSWMVFAKACALFHRRLKSRNQARCLSVNRDAADGETPIA